jgi:hypothetical protein
MEGVGSGSEPVGLDEWMSGLAEARVRRCDVSCTVRVECVYRRKVAGRPSRRTGPCAREVAFYRRSVEALTGGGEGYELVEAASDAACIDLLIDRCLRLLAEEGLFYREPKSSKGGEDGAGPVKTQMQPAVDQLMRLFERKHKLIDACRAHRAADDGPEENVSFAELMKKMLEVAGKDIHGGSEYDVGAEEIEATGTLPGACRDGA